MNLIDPSYEETFPLKSIEASKVVIGGMWGEFTLRRDQIMGGVRFSMLDCPNALAFTITSRNAEEVTACAKLAHQVGAHTAVFRPLYPVGTALRNEYHD